MNFFICPICKSPFEQKGRSLVCPKNHCFDLSKQGYVNLLRPSKSGSVRHGDDKLMVSARSAFLGAGFYDDGITAEEILELDDYCYENFIDFIPSLSTFGHLYRLLETKEYKHLCELPDYVDSSHYWNERMPHHTIDPSNPESIEIIKSLIDQYVPLFTSNKFNICCDD